MQIFLPIGKYIILWNFYCLLPKYVHKNKLCIYIIYSNNKNIQKK